MTVRKWLFKSAAVTLAVGALGSWTAAYHELHLVGVQRQPIRGLAPQLAQEGAAFPKAL